MLLLLGWISIALLVAIAALPVWFPTRGVPDELSQAEVLLGFGIYCLLCLLIGTALKRHRPWARVSGAVLSVFSLPYFPFGTACGIATLVYLVRGWHEGPEI
jgi:hypothetical protein